MSSKAEFEQAMASMPVEELIEMQNKETKEECVAFLKLFSSPAEFESWWKGLDAAKVAALEAAETPEHKAMAEAAFGEVFGA